MGSRAGPRNIKRAHRAEQLTASRSRRHPCHANDNHIQGPPGPKALNPTLLSRKGISPQRAKSQRALELGLSIPASFAKFQAFGVDSARPLDSSCTAGPETTRNPLRDLRDLRAQHVEGCQCRVLSGGQSLGMRLRTQNLKVWGACLAVCWGVCYHGGKSGGRSGN